MLKLAQKFSGSSPGSQFLVIQIFERIKSSALSCLGFCSIKFLKSSSLPQTITKRTIKTLGTIQMLTAFRCNLTRKIPLPRDQPNSSSNNLPLTEAEVDPKKSHCPQVLCLLNGRLLILKRYKLKLSHPSGTYSIRMIPPIRKTIWTKRTLTVI